MPVYTAPELRFWDKVLKTNDCWEWVAQRDKDGYGQLRVGTVKEGNRTYAKAHRFSYYLAFGEFDPLLKVCHKCDNPSCVRPDHLFLGTQKENIADCIQKKRFARGKDKPLTIKLTEKQVIEIRRRYSNGENQPTPLISLFRMSSLTLLLIVRV